MKNITKRITKIYIKRDKAYATLLECDIELDKLLKYYVGFGWLKK